LSAFEVTKFILESNSKLLENSGMKIECDCLLSWQGNTSDTEIASLRSWVLSHFPGPSIEDKTYHGQIRLSVPAQRDEVKHETKIVIAEVDVDEIKGGMLEDHREEMGLEHYSVSPTTLDQVFLTIVGRHDVQEEGYAGGKPKRKFVKFWKRG
jgi:hypothetical protein